MRKNLLLLHLLMLLGVFNSFGQALNFNGSSNYVNIGNDASLHLKNFTLEAWIKMNGVGATTETSKRNDGFRSSTVVPIIAKGRRQDESVATAVNYFFGYRPSDMRLVADFEDDATNANHKVVSNQVLSTTDWVHVAATYNTATSTWKLYINGALDKTLALPGSFTPQSLSTVPSAIAAALNSNSSPDGFFSGKIDEVRIWNIVRSDADILNNYKLELTSGAGLVARYGFNEGTGTIAANAVSSASNGTLTNGPQWTTGYFTASPPSNTPPAAPATPSPANGATFYAAGTSLCTTVSDPNNNPLRIRYYGRKKAGSTGKFTIVLIPDPQYYVSEPQGQAYIRGAYSFMFQSQTSWIVNNRVSKNIAFVAGLGDCSDHGDTFDVEWRRVDTAIRYLENPTTTGLPQGIPYGLAVGNHDQSPRGNVNGTTALYNQYFGSSRFSGRPYYGGHSGTNNNNNYQLFSAGGIDFLVLSPEYDPTTNFSAAGGALDWMESIVKAYPARKVIVVSHFVLQLNAVFSAQGKAIYDRLKYYPNFFLMAGGHIVDFNSGLGEARRSDTLNGNVVQTITQDYQARVNGGNGLLRTYGFDPANNSISVQTYSPYTNTFETDANSTFTLNVNLSAAVNTAPNAYTLIGEVSNAASGSKPCVNWPGLDLNADYEWYAEAYDGQSTTAGPVWSFSTRGATAGILKSDIQQTDIAAQPLPGELFMLYPNPDNHHRFNVSFTEQVKGVVSIEVFNAAGNLQLQKVYNQSNTIVSIEHHLAAGTYMVVVKSATARQTKKLVVSQ